MSSPVVSGVSARTVLALTNVSGLRSGGGAREQAAGGRYSEREAATNNKNTWTLRGAIRLTLPPESLRAHTHLSTLSRCSIIDTT